MVIQLAKPYDEEEAKRMMARAQYTPRPAPVAPPEKGMVQTVAETVGANAMGKVGDAAAGKLGKMALGKGTELMAGLNTAGAPLGAMLPGGATAGAAGAGLMPMMAAAAPWLAGAAVLGKVFKLFNSGGPVPRGPLYAGEGSYTYPSVNWVPWYGGTLGQLEDEAKENRLYDSDRTPSEWEIKGYDKMFPKFKGITRNRGGLVDGPLSNNKA